MEDTNLSFANKKETVTPQNNNEIIYEQYLNNLAEHESKSQQSVSEFESISKQLVIEPQPISQPLIPDEITSHETVVRRTISGRIIKTPSRFK